MYGSKADRTNQIVDYFYLFTLLSSLVHVAIMLDVVAIVTVAVVVVAVVVVHNTVSH